MPRPRKARELLKIVNGPYGVLARPYSLPPGTPKDRLEILQKAFMATSKDPGLLAEAEKAKVDFKATDGPATTRMFAEIYEMKPAVAATLKEIILPKK